MKTKSCYTCRSADWDEDNPRCNDCETFNKWEKRKEFYRQEPVKAKE
jgi:hypothetical protein